MQRAPALCGVWEGCQWQALPSPVQCEETVTRTQDLPVTGGKTLPLAPGPPFKKELMEIMIANYYNLSHDAQTRKYCNTNSAYRYSKHELNIMHDGYKI